ncbi:MAG TPA: winged helix-turn-helix domain-containing protein [Nitrososphaerales archaeon]|nr:winged helix-turn-helix domain-containing protein [Nitrososphaerales archaeon]
MVATGTSTKLQEIDIEEARRKLMAYEGLDNITRLRAFFVIRDNPGITFNEIAKAVKAGRALVAYHLGVLKVGGLVTFTYARKGKATSSYNLTESGKKVAKELAAAVR